MGLAGTGKMENMSDGSLFPGLMRRQHPLLGRPHTLAGEPIMDLFA